jgi:thiamine pyrophosphate-dependent acetolactate synthase large subunit-like protein
MPANRSCGEAIAGLLEAYGVDTVFGIPGVHTLELYKGLAGSNIRHVLPRHEQGAGFMADGYARASGRNLRTRRHQYRDRNRPSLV